MLLGRVGGVACLVREQHTSGLQVSLKTFFFSRSACFKAAELYLNYFPNLLFTSLRTHDLLLKGS